VQYVADFRDAITFGISLPGVDARRIGVWGSSYGGGIVIQAAALDARISCVAAQVPFLSGGAIWRSLPAEAKAGLTAGQSGEAVGDNQIKF
jgi:cephalosporin-C deacetylase-like acetyl esterase